MQRYITQLLEDLEKAKSHQPPPVDYALLYPDHPAADYGLDYIIEWENGEDWKMDDLFGIPAEVFPPESKLSEAEISALAQGIVSLWQSFNIDVHIPDERIPSRTIYQVLLNYWRTEPVQYVSQETIHLDLCEYDPETCIWGNDYCTCKEFIAEEMQEQEGKKYELY